MQLNVWLINRVNLWSWITKNTGCNHIKEVTFYYFFSVCVKICSCWVLQWWWIRYILVKLTINSLLNKIFFWHAGESVTITSQIPLAEENQKLKKQIEDLKKQLSPKTQQVPSSYSKGNNKLYFSFVKTHFMTMIKANCGIMYFNFSQCRCKQIKNIVIVKIIRRIK